MNETLLYKTLGDMDECFQHESMSVKFHGEIVYSYVYLFEKILSGFETHHIVKLPEWFIKYGQELFNMIADREAFSIYVNMHDCGKPYCQTVDENGKQHFPNHAQISYEKWLEIDGPGYIASCILHDMDMHTIKGSDCAAFAARPEAPSLMIAALAEIHANAKMFGGIDSQGFKIKYAQIERRGKQICKILFGE